MNRGTFFEAAGKLSDRIENLYCTTEATLCDIEDDLCRKQDPRLDIQTSIRADLGMISFRIVQVMTAFDALCKAAGEEPPFELAFQVLDAPSRVQRDLRQRTDGTRPAPSD
jgi:hypothetical protein